MKKLFGLIFILLLLLVVNSCDKAVLCQENEIDRKPSPDMRVDAVIVQTNCGATTSNSYKIFIIPSGEEVQGAHVYLSDKTKGLEVSWFADKKLHIKYKQARIFEFTNFWQSSKIDNYGYDVSIKESKK